MNDKKQNLIVTLSAVAVVLVLVFAIFLISNNTQRTLLIERVDSSASDSGSSGDFSSTDQAIADSDSDLPTDSEDSGEIISSDEEASNGEASSEEDNSSENLSSEDATVPESGSEEPTSADTSSEETPAPVTPKPDSTTAPATAPETPKPADTTAPTAPPDTPKPETTTTTPKPQTTTTTTTTATTPKPETTTTTTKKKDDAPAAGKYTVAYSSNNSWEDSGTNMYGAEIQIVNNTNNAVSGWKLELTITGIKSATGWNGTYTVSGNTLTITNAEYNGDIAVNGSVTVGCNLGCSGSFKITKALLNGVSCDIKEGTISDGNNNNNDNNNNDNNNDDDKVDVSELLERPEGHVQGDDWLFASGNRIVDKNGKEVWLTGVNWFGYNTGTNTFDGLWGSELVSSVEAIADHGFNVIRVPISAELINSWAHGVYPKANYNQAYNPTLNSMNSLEIFDYFIVLAEKNGMKIILDIHSAETNAMGHMVNLWYTDKITTDQYYAALEYMAKRYKSNDTVIAFDLKNEPHGKPYEGDGAAIWNNSNAKNNWKKVAETAAMKVLNQNPNVLILVEGIEIYPRDINKNSDFSSRNDADYYFNWWGGNLRGVRDYPINLGKYQNKLVYSPHDYGPSVYEQPWFKGGYDYNSLMKDCWRDNWFYIYENKTAPLLIGEWGGFMKEPNLKWMTCMRQLIKTYHLHHTFWCFNANSGDTGGLVLDDFKTWDTEKYNFVKEVIWQENGKFVGLDHAIPLGKNGITLTKAKGLS